MKFSTTIITIALFTFPGAKIFAQAGTTSIGGTVFDRQNQIIVGASVTLTNTEKGFSRTATTNENGTFSFPAIQPGVYRLEIELNGFKKYINNEIRAIVDTPTKISIVLEIGNIHETVTVKSDTAESLINMHDASIGNPFTANQSVQLPTEAREVINLLTLQPGVTRFGYVVGGRSDQANITLDGIDINNPIFNQISSPNLRLNAEAIEEFRVTITNPNVAHGRSSGAQISLVTKSGTNEFRGALFLTGRRTEWTANDFFNNRDGVERPKLDRNVFGGALGGAIIKNRAFFFYSYEGERTTRGETVVRIVPLENLGQGIVRFRNTKGQIVSLNCSQITAAFPNTNIGCNPLGLAVFADAASRYRANSFGVGDTLNTDGFRFNGDTKIKNNSHVLRLDFNLSVNQQAFFRANYINDLEINAPQFPDTPAPSSWSHPTGFVVGHSWTISAKIFNNFRYGTTRNAFSNVGDLSGNAISFTNIYSPRRSGRGNSAIDSVRTLTDDVSWIWRNHTFQFGANIRLTRSRLHSFARAYDSATVAAANFSGGDNAILNPVNNYLQSTFGYRIAETDMTSVQNAAAAVIGRYSAYAANFTFLRDGALQPVGTPRDRDFRSEAYDFYAQDIWKISPNLTATFGLRYELSRPIYEAKGYEVKPNLGLSEYFALRANGAATGVPYNQPIVLDLSGAANGRTPLYPWDKNNFQPRFALAWSPNFGWFFGKNNESVLRGGFAVSNDYFTVFNMARFENQNTLGFVSRSQIQNRSIENSPLFTGFNQNIRILPLITLPVGNLTFPRQAALVNSPSANELSFDENITAPIHYNWSLTFERALPKGLIVSISYLGHRGRNLLQPRDAAAIANFVDTQSGTDWNTAATQLEILRQRGTPVSQIPQIAYFANLFPSNLAASIGCPPNLNQTQAVYALVSSGCATSLDWVRAQRILSRLSTSFPGQHIYFQPQYGGYRALSSIGKSDYQGLTFTVRQRLGTRLAADFNYTFSKSADDGSGLQSALNNPLVAVVNPFRQEDFYAASDFDMRHIINANAIFKLPFGHGEMFFGKINRFADFFIGGWQIAGIFRYNSGAPISAPNDNRLATSLSIRSYAVRANAVQTCPTRGGSLFGCSAMEAYRSFRNAYPGETGERNIFRLPSFWVIDLGFGKTFDLPRENHKLQFRWEVFNVANTQKMGNVIGYQIELDPQTAAQVPTNFANFTSIQGSPRSMQFVLRYSF